ncbi:hypothetical protein BIW11_03609, partial [Tropilaelaps mercedesae]
TPEAGPRPTPEAGPRPTPEAGLRPTPAADQHLTPAADPHLTPAADPGPTLTAHARPTLTARARPPQTARALLRAAGRSRSTLPAQGAEDPPGMQTTPAPETPQRLEESTGPGGDVAEERPVSAKATKDAFDLEELKAAFIDSFHGKAPDMCVRQPPPAGQLEGRQIALISNLFPIRFCPEERFTTTTLRLRPSTLQCEREYLSKNALVALPPSSTAMSWKPLRASTAPSSVTVCQRTTVERTCTFGKSLALQSTIRCSW